MKSFKLKENKMKISPNLIGQKCTLVFLYLKKKKKDLALSCLKVLPPIECIYSKIFELLVMLQK